MTKNEKIKELFNTINSEIPMEASFNDTIESANEKLLKDHISTKKICLIVIDEKIETFYRLCGQRKEFWSADENSYIKELISMQQEVELL